MLGFKSFFSARGTMASIKLVTIITEDQIKKNAVRSLSSAEQLYTLAA